MTPEQRRRITSALMADQYNRATPEEGTVAQRHGLLPLATYDDGRTGLAFPGIVAEPVESFNRLLQYGYTPGDSRGVEDAFNVAGGAMVGGAVVPRPRNSLGALSTQIEKQIHEAKVAANPGVDTFAVPVTTINKNGELVIASPAGSITGSLGPKNAIEIWSSGLDSNRNQGLGYGAALYDEAARMAARYGGKLTSDHTVSPLAQRMYSRMGRNYDVEANPSAVRQASGALETPDASPVFTVNVPQQGTPPPPLPADVVYANGGRPGAAAGAAVNAAGERGTVRAYRGSNGEFDISNFDPSAANPAWRTNEGALFFGSHDVANFYGAPQTAFDQQLYSSIVKKHTKPDGRLNPQAIAREYDSVAPQEGMASVMPADINTNKFGSVNLFGYRWDSDEGAKLKAKIDAAKAQGKEGLIINGMMDASGYPDTQYAVWGRGNVKSPLTGELLYSNGGRPGAAISQIAQALGYYGEPQQPRPWNALMRPGDA